MPSNSGIAGRGKLEANEATYFLIVSDK